MGGIVGELSDLVGKVFIWYRLFFLNELWWFLCVVIMFIRL